MERYSNAPVSITPVPQAVSGTDQYGIWISIDCSGSVCFLGGIMCTAFEVTDFLCGLLSCIVRVR